MFIPERSCSSIVVVISGSHGDHHSFVALRAGLLERGP